jgi:hypothetical protein
VEQVPWAFTKTATMEPFRKLLSSKTVFAWSQDLQESFEKARLMIVKAVIDGIKSFETGSMTCLNTDWSKIGICLSIMHKYCNG